MKLQEQIDYFRSIGMAPLRIASACGLSLGEAQRMGLVAVASPDTFGTDPRGIKTTPPKAARRPVVRRMPPAKSVPIPSVKTAKWLAAENLKQWQAKAVAILETTCKVNGLSVEIVKGRRRCHPISRARAMAGIMMAEMTGLSLPNMACILGLSDHTSVMYYLEKADSYAKEDREWGRRRRKIRKIVEAAHAPCN